MAYSSKAAKSRKPSKPHKDFPLFPHANGQWAKKIRGKLHYFGSWDDADGALNRWINSKDYLLAGKALPSNKDGLTVKELSNAFLTDRKHRLEAGDIVARTFRDYFDSCERLIRQLGSDQLVVDLRPEDFTSLRSELAKRLGPVALGNEIQRIRTLFKYAFDADLIDRPVKHGPTFTKPARKVMRRVRNEKGPRMFDAAELRQVIEAATQPLRAMILLGVNCGFGNADCGKLPLSAIDLAGKWIDYPRPKTEVKRRCPLWAETVDSLNDALSQRKEPKDVANEPLAFITKYGGPWVSDKDPSIIGKEIRKLLDKLVLHRPGLGFYALRHTFETIGGESRDQVAVNHIMGHEANDMATVYRERISDERLKAVTDHVHAWLYGSEGGAK